MHAKPTHRKARPKASERGCAFRFGYNRSAKVVIPIKLCKFFHIRVFGSSGNNKRSQRCGRLFRRFILLLAEGASGVHKQAYPTIHSQRH